jgi:hypothetical protein
MKMRNLFAGVLLLSCAGMAHSAAAAREDLNGVWRIAAPVHSLRTADGAEPPLLPEARALYEQHQRARAAGDLSFDRATWCASPGVPRLLLEDYPFEIMVDRRQVGFFFEWNRWVRLVDMSGAELEVYYPLSFGVPSGHWEADDSLVVQSSGLMHETLMDRSGLPHSDALTMTEHWRLVDANTLENRVRFEDPETFSQAWETVLTYKRQPGARLQEDVCLDRIKQGGAPL